MAMETDISAQKKALRRELLGVLKAIPKTGRLASDAAIRRQVEFLPQFRQAGRLFIFVGDGWEVDTRPLIEAALSAGRQVAVPRCLPGGVMHVCQINGCGDLRQVPPLGLWEPSDSARLLLPEEIDLALIPCVACDREGRRLGRGGGYYDRFLLSVKFIKAALCREALLQGALPEEDHDVKMDIIITERQSLWRI